jgi:hypothetical protein
MNKDKSRKVRDKHAELGRAFEWALDEGFELIFRNYDYNLDKMVDVEVIKTKEKLLEIYRS